MGMRSCDSRCLFSGSKGEVCAIEPLLAPPDLREHPITHYSLLAMASLTKVGAAPTLPAAAVTFDPGRLLSFQRVSVLDRSW